MRKTNKKLLSEKMYIRRILSVYFALHILLFSVFALCCGVASARRGSEKIWRGTEETCIYIEDLNKWTASFLRQLYDCYNNVKLLTLF